jgi:general secretion pathway protein F
MPAFSYRASTFEGKVVEGTMDAADGGAVALKLQDMGLLPIQVGLTSSKSVLSREIDWPWKRRKLRGKDVLVFTSELHTLVKSGIPLDRSLAVLAELAESEQLGQVIREVLKEIKAGKSLSEGLGKFPDVFPKIYVNMVRAGEVGGFLEEVLARLATFLEMSENLRSYIATALAYPVLLSGVGVVSVTILTLFVVPRFAAIFHDMNVPMPLPMVILTGLSEFIASYWWLLLVAVAGSVTYFRRFRSSPEGRLAWDRWLLRIPLLGKVLQKIEVARFTRTLGTLLHSGVPLLEAMSIVREIIGNQGIASMIEPIRAGIKKGEGISQPMKASGVFPPLAMHLVEVGEETGRLDTMLAQVADVYDEDVRHSVKGLISFFEPALILVMGIIIGTIVVSMLLAIFSINDVPL